MKMTRLFQDFFRSEKSGGLVLIACTAFSLLLANTDVAESYLHLWRTELAGHPLAHWINDGLMAIFFLLVGLELEREVYVGELSHFKNALLPVLAALGGMLVPAGIHFLFNSGTATQAGAGIPMATDIAFALAVLSLLGSRVPASLKIFLTALAVIDDLGAIIAIAFFYTGSPQWVNLMISLSIFGVLLIFNRLKIRHLTLYLIGGVGMWYFMLHSGIHATLSGVLLAFAIPFGKGDEKSASFVLQRFLHWPVAFLILPLFALANTAVTLPEQWTSVLAKPNSLGIFFGLSFGKPLGIFLFAYLSVLFKLTRLPAKLRWAHIAGAGFLGGIGFTMSIFIALLAFADKTTIDESKIMILLASVFSGITGYTLLHFFLKQKPSPNEHH